MCMRDGKKGEEKLKRPHEMHVPVNWTFPTT